MSDIHGIISCADNLAKAFYAWIQVRNIGAVAKGDEDRARLHYEKAIKLKFFRAWLYCQVGVAILSCGCGSTQFCEKIVPYIIVV